MSARSITVSQTNFCDAMLHVNISSEPKVVMTHLSLELESQLYSCRKCHNEISREFRKRMYEYKFSVQKGQITPVSRHFKSEGHNHKYMLFSVLDWCTPKLYIHAHPGAEGLSWHGFPNYTL